jgi:ABC-type uncharacterized transport system permease subunit
MSCGVEPAVNFFPHFFFALAVFCLKRAFKLLAVAVNLRNLIVGQLAPLFLELAGKLLPFAFDLILIHVSLLYLCFSKTRRGAPDINCGLWFWFLKGKRNLKRPLG